MERIKNAIDKRNKQEANLTIRPTQQLLSGQPKVLDEPIYKAPQRLENVNYNQTRVVKLHAAHLEKNHIIAFNKDDPAGIHFDLLRTMVLQKMEMRGWRTLAITSPTTEAGKTVVAINLAMSIAQQTDRTAMLVDFDLRRPKLGTYLGIPMEKSLNDLLDGTAELQDVLVNPGIPRLVVLPTKSAVKKSSEILSSKKIADLINELRERYESRIVIFDLPPVLVADDVIALLPQIDCFLMVVANGMTTKREIEDSFHLLPTENIIGTVFNKAEIEPRTYY